VNVTIRREELRAACRRAADRWLDRLVELCAVRSVAGEAGGMEAAACLVERWLAELGANTRVLTGASARAIYGEVAGVGPRSILFYNHYDVLEEGEGWTSPAFEPVLRDGSLYARGVADNKGNLVARMAALDAMKELGIRPPVTLKFFVEGEEEIGSPGLETLVARNGELLRAEACVWEGGYKDASGRPTIRLGQKGLLRARLRCRCLCSDAHSKMAAVLKNAAWRLVWALASLKGPDDRIVVEGFYDAVEVPTEADLACIAQASGDEGAGPAGAEFLPGTVRGNITRRLLFEPTLNISSLSAGSGSKTILPAEASAMVDVRLVPNQDPCEVTRSLRRHLDSAGFGDVEIEVCGSSHPSRTPPDSPIAVCAREAARDVYGEEPMVYPLSPGSGPMYVVCGSRGMPAVAFGVGHDGSRTHGPDENIRVVDFEQGIAMIVATIARFGRTE